MPNQYDYKKFAVLYVDDEEKALTGFARAFGDDFRILTAANARDGLALIQQQGADIGLLLSDQRMPAENGVWLLERARELHPQMLRVLVTAFSDMDAAVAAVNKGAIYKYIHKPWDPTELELTMRKCLEHFMVTRERDELLREKMSVLRNVMLADRVVSLGLLAAGLSHHIRNSMVAVKTFLELAPIKMAEEKGSGESLRDPEFWRDYHHSVQGQIEKINTLLGDLRSASEKNPEDPFSDAIQLRPTIAAILEKNTATFAARKLQVENRIPENLPALHVDHPKFDRMFELLIKDEVAMLPVGSRLVFDAQLRGAEMLITLTDDGPPLPKEALRIILDPFRISSGAPSEYGINLMACFFIAHHHGGKIEAHNLPGAGNLITIRLPLQPGTVASTGETEFLRKNVLEDNLWNRVQSSL